MKKLLYFLFATVACVGCSKNTEPIEPNTKVGDPMVFTVTDFNTSVRSTDLKTGWAENDKIAVFETTQPYSSKCYQVDNTEDLTISAVEGEDPFYVSETSLSYVAYYPYIETFNEYDYQQALSLAFCDKDILSSTYSEGKFSFSHQFSCLTINISTTSKTFDATINIGSDSHSISTSDVIIDNDVVSYSVCVQPITSDFAEVAKSIDFSTDDGINYSADFTSGINRDGTSIEITSWLAGYNYIYKFDK